MVTLKNRLVLVILRKSAISPAARSVITPNAMAANYHTYALSFSQENALTMWLFLNPALTPFLLLLFAASTCCSKLLWRVEERVWIERSAAPYLAVICQLYP